MDGDALGGQRIALLAGGNSTEREVSLASGHQSAAALVTAGYRPVVIDPLDVRLGALDWATFDACFIALHGGAGEDGSVQAELKELGVAYTGSGPAASRLAMSKSAAKERFSRRGVPTPPYTVFPASEAPERVAAIAARLGYPLVLKPEGQGSSLGVAIAKSSRDLLPAVASAAEFGTHVVAERFVRGREFTVALLGRDPLPLVEIVSADAVYTYEAKYSNSATEYRTQCGLSPEIESRLKHAAVAAAQAIGTAGLARVDLMLDDKGQPWVIEVNTVPGLTAHSLAPRAAQAADMDMARLVDWMVRDALVRFGQRAATNPLARKTRDSTSHKVLTARVRRRRAVTRAFVEDAA